MVTTGCENSRLLAFPVPASTVTGMNSSRQHTTASIGTKSKNSVCERALIDLVVQALAATRQLADLAELSRDEDRLSRSEWRCVEAWSAALTQIHLTALCALPENLHALV
jgi:hypothetical protein